MNEWLARFLSAGFAGLGHSLGTNLNERKILEAMEILDGEFIFYGCD